MKFPDFIVIGAYKAGTTALWYNLDKHPDITMCKGGSKTESLGTEVNYWHGRNWDKGLSWYKSSFVGDFCGEKSPGYMHSHDAMKAIYEHMPDVKLVIALRNPIDRAYSSFQVGVRRGRTKSELSFDKATTGKLFVMSDYSGILEKSILPFFSKQNIHCVVSEWARKDLNSELSRLHKFLGVSAHSLDVEKFDNPGNSVSKSENPVHAKRSNYQDWKSKYKPISEKLRQRLLDFYNPHNDRLFDFLGYDIPEWNN